MISNKPRPPDGPGSNGLRGGKKNYSARTAVGSWLDECGGPQGYSRGFHDPDFLTEAQNLQLSVTNKKLGEFGAGIKNPNGNGFTNKEVFQPPCHVDWQTNYQAMTQSKFDDKVSKGPRQSISNEALSTYRSKWTVDNPTSRDIRFQTESRRMFGYMDDKFAVPSTRQMAGAPKGLERLKTSLVEKYGILAVTMFRHAIGNTNEITVAELRDVLRSLEVSVSSSDFNQTVAYLTSKENIVVEKLMRVFVGRVENFDERKVRDLFETLQSKLSLSKDQYIPMESLADMISSLTYPVVADAIKERLSVYTTESSVIGINHFLTLGYDMFSSAPLQFMDVFSKLWKV